MLKKLRDGGFSYGVPRWVVWAGKGGWTNPITGQVYLSAEWFANGTQPGELAFVATHEIGHVKHGLWSEKAVDGFACRAVPNRGYLSVGLYGTSPACGAAP